MMITRLTIRSGIKALGGLNDNGYSLLELMIALFVSSIVVWAAFLTYSSASKTFSKQREVASIQQDMRGSFYMMEFDLMNAGRDPNQTFQYGITDVRYYQYNRADNGFDTGALDTLGAPPAPGAQPPFQAYPVIEFSALRNDTDSDGEGDDRMTIRYQIYDYNNDGTLDLCRRVAFGNAGIAGTARELVATGVIAIGYAFAYDTNPNGVYQLNRTPPDPGETMGEVIWAADTDGDNRLDTNLDRNGDGDITLADDDSGDGIINNGDMGPAIGAPVDLVAIRAVRVMMLLQSETESKEGINPNEQYMVGDRVIDPSADGPADPLNNDQFVRQLHTVAVAMRNFPKTSQ